MKKAVIPVFVVIVCLLLNLHPASAVSSCQTSIAVQRGNINSIEADASREVRILPSSFFGFNLEWLEFQLGLWDRSSHRVSPSLISIFGDFPGAVYRFPGGTNSNHIDWRDATGSYEARPLRKHVSWLPPIRAELGVDEYLDFVKAVKGQAWWVANLYGSFEKQEESRALAENAGRLAAYLKMKEAEGFSPILRWELGNELDRPPYKWSPKEISDTALLVADEIKRNYVGAKFVHLQQEYPAQADRGYKASEYNQELRSRMTSLHPDYSMHFYFDGPPDSPPVDYFLRRMCEVIDASKNEGRDGKIWITENGRVPNAFFSKQQKELWPATANLQAAVSVADMYIALAQIPETQGVFAHSLVAGNSPWPLVHRSNNGDLYPSVPLLGMKILRSSMLPVVLNSSQYSSASGGLGANYATRAVVMTNVERRKYSIWAINKTDVSQEFSIKINKIKGKLVFSGSSVVNDQQVVANNYLDKNRVAIGVDMVIPKHNPVDKTWLVGLPPNSISVMQFKSEY